MSCPMPSCGETGPHRHPMLGDGLFDPPAVRVVVAPAEGDGMERLTVSLAEIPLVCPKCGSSWTGPAFSALKPGEVRRERICGRCEPAPEATVNPAPSGLRQLKAPRRLGARELGERD